MAGLTDRDLRRIERFVETPPRQRTPHILTPDEECEGRADAASAALGECEGRADAVSDEAETEAAAETDVEAAE
jgi:hypothetical protein